jgi:hypothetical protein
MRRGPKTVSKIRPPFVCIGRALTNRMARTRAQKARMSVKRALLSFEEGRDEQNVSAQTDHHITVPREHEMATTQPWGLRASRAAAEPLGVPPHVSVSRTVRSPEAERSFPSLPASTFPLDKSLRLLFLWCRGIKLFNRRGYRQCLTYGGSGAAAVPGATRRVVESGMIPDTLDHAGRAG